MQKSLLTLYLLLFSLPVFCQNENGKDSLEIPLSVNDLTPVTVTAYRLEELEREVPLAITRIGEHRLHQGEQQLTLNDALSSVPGLYTQNAENFAQDLRVAIRGFGARSTFGIRGVKVLVDGFPETTPDGQGQVDNIDPAMLQSVEVVRGQTAGLYGNASGGLIHFTTLDFTGKGRLEAGYRFGSFAFQKYYLKAAGKAGKVRYSFFGSHLKRDGYRDHSETVSYLLNGGIHLPVDSTLSLTFVLNYANSPKANDPGSLSLEQATEEPTQAVSTYSGEEVRQGRLGVFLEKKVGQKDQFSFRGFSVQRNFGNAILPFIGELDRSFSGLNLAWGHSGNSAKTPWQFHLGAGLESQTDERERFRHNGGEKGSTFDKRIEGYLNASAVMSAKLKVLEMVNLHAALRFDHIEMSLENEFRQILEQEETKDQKDMNALNPMAGIAFAFDPTCNLYLTFSTAFETPSMLEAVSTSGRWLNPDIVPQRSTTRELGIKGWPSQGRLRYDLAAFIIKTEDEIVPFVQVDDFFRYRNLGATTRLGYEFSLGSRLAKDLYAYASYTNSDFRFDRDTRPASIEIARKRLPGIPEQYFSAELRYQPNAGFFFTATTQHIGLQFADSENMVEIEPYWLLNCRAGFVWEADKLRSEIFYGVNNFLDTSYFSNLRINDGNGRYYEPGPERNFVVGVSFRFRK